MDVLSKGRILLYDELERSLHPAIVSNLLAVVKKWRGDTQPQLIFTTHDTSLLDLDLFRRDQIWFAERNPETKSSEYYSLVELKNVRKDENIRKGYVMGRYAPIPLKGSSLMEVLDGEHYGA
jgi:AAA15 family ATPase/GTPase